MLLLRITINVTTAAIVGLEITNATIVNQAVKNFQERDESLFPLLINATKKMKFSKFNSVIELKGDYSILFNSYTKTYIIFKSTLKNIFKDSQIDHIKNKYPNLHTKLINTGCLISDEINEIDLLKKKSNFINNNNDNYIIIINPTLDCNFRCWYCYESHIKNSVMDKDTIEHVKKFIANTVEDKNINRIYLSFLEENPY